MKTLLLILSLVLSLFSGDRNKTDAFIPSNEGTSCMAEAGLNKDFWIAATQGQTFARNNCSNSFSVLTTHAGRRTSPQTRSTFRVIKGGKVIDYNRMHPFLNPVFTPLSGTHISGRFLFSICRLRL